MTWPVQYTTKRLCFSDYKQNATLWANTFDNLMQCINTLKIIKYYAISKYISSITRNTVRGKISARYRHGVK